MSVKNDRTERVSCTFCGEELGRPYVYWNLPHAETYICGKCCVNNRHGLMADMVQVAAIVEMRAVNPSAVGEVLVRVIGRDAPGIPHLIVSMDHPPAPLEGVVARLRGRSER